MPSKYLCNLVIPGAGKSGTSSLHEYLNAHPLISMSYNKEPHHFCIDERYQRGAQDHNLLFENKNGVRYFGESSTGYLPWKVAAERIGQDLDEPKAIIILRHPVERCFSHYRWRYRLGLEKRSFLEAVKIDGMGFDPAHPAGFGHMAYIEFSQYSRQCPIWQEALGIENCLFLKSDDLLRNRQMSLSICYNFLGLSTFEQSAVFDVVNETSTLARRPSPTVTKVASVIPTGFKSSSLYRKFRHKILKFVAPSPPTKMTVEERNFVEDKLADDIVWYERCFGKD